MTLHVFNISPANGSDVEGDGIAVPFKTVTHAAAVIGAAPAAPNDQAILLVVNQTQPFVENISLPRHNWVTTAGGMIVDLGGNTLAPPSGACCTVVGAPDPWILQNGVLEPPPGGWGIEADNASNLWVGSGIAIRGPSASFAAGGILSNAKANLVVYGEIAFSGMLGFLAQASYDSLFLYEPSQIRIDRDITVISWFQAITGGKAAFSASTTFVGGGKKTRQGAANVSIDALPSAFFGDVVFP